MSNASSGAAAGGSELAANLPMPVRPHVDLSMSGSGADATAPLLAAFFAGRSARTLDAYRRDLDGFCRFVGAATLGDAAHRLLASPHGEANHIAILYRAHLLERGYATATVNRRLAALRALVALACTLGLVPWTLNVEGVRGEAYRDTRGPGRAGFQRLLEALAGRADAKSARDHAIVRLLYDVALRRGEVASLDLAHVDLEASALAVLGKGRTERTSLTLPPETRAALARWLAARGEAPGPLFLNFDRAGKGQRLTGRSLHRIIVRLGERAGVVVRPHGLRHAAITDALDLTNGNTRAVQRFSRHRDLRTLTRYDDNRTDLGGEIAALVAKAATA